MKFARRIAGLPIALLGLTGALSAQQPLTLDEAIARSLQVHPAMAAGARRPGQRGVSHRAAWGGFLPTLSVSSGASTNSSQRFDQATQRTVAGASESYNAGLSLAYSLFNGGQRFADMDRARADIASAEADMENQRFGVILQTKDLYFAALRQSDLLEVARASVDRAEESLANTRRRTELGSGTRSDTLRARLEVANAMQAVLQAEAATRAARFNLGRQVGLSEPVMPERPDDLDPSPLVLTDQEMFLLGEERSPAVRSARAAARAASAAASSSKSSRFPSSPSLRLQRRPGKRLNGGHFLECPRLGQHNVFDGSPDQNIARRESGTRRLRTGGGCQTSGPLPGGRSALRAEDLRAGHRHRHRGERGGCGGPPRRAAALRSLGCDDPRPDHESDRPRTGRVRSGYSAIRLRGRACATGGDSGERTVSRPVIQTLDLTKHYVLGAETIRALRRVDLEIVRGEFVAIMGPSGSGKSTFMNLIGCLDTPTRGQYWLNEQLVSDLSDDQLAHVRNRDIGFVFQTFNLLPRATALHNVELPLIYAGVSARERRRRAREALETVGLGLRMDHRPPELSGGQRQRVAVARALVNGPAILLADEPTGNLDSTTSEEIMSVLVELHRQGQTILVVTHEHDIAQYAQRQIHLRDGLVERDFMNEPLMTATV